LPLDVNALNYFWDNQRNYSLENPKHKYISILQIFPVSTCFHYSTVCYEKEIL